MAETDRRESAKAGLAILAFGFVVSPVTHAVLGHGGGLDLAFLDSWGTHERSGSTLDHEESEPDAHHGSTPDAHHGSTPDAHHGSTAHAPHGSTAHAHRGSTPHSHHGTRSEGRDHAHPDGSLEHLGACCAPAADTPIAAELVGTFEESHAALKQIPEGRRVRSPAMPQGP